jgi:predicted PurR-regulated permease PerM
MKPIIQNLVGIAALVVIIAGLKLGASLINPILLAFLLTMCITPLPEWLIKKGISKNMSILISLVVIMVGGFLISAALAHSIASMVESIPEYEKRLRILYHDLETFAATQNVDISHFVNKSNISPEKIMDFVGKIIQELTKLVSSSFVIALLIAFMIIELITYSMELRKGRRDEAFHLTWLTGIGGKLRKYVNLTALTGLITAVLNFIFLLVMGVDFPFIWAFISFLMVFIPSIGFIFSFIGPALITLIMKGPWQALFILIGFWVINFVVENVIRPIFMKHGLNISLLTTFFSLLVWSWILGVPGAILGVPLTIAVMKIYKDMTDVKEM